MRKGEIIEIPSVYDLEGKVIDINTEDVDTGITINWVKVTKVSENGRELSCMILGDIAKKVGSRTIDISASDLIYDGTRIMELTTYRQLQKENKLLCMA